MFGPVPILNHAAGNTLAAIFFERNEFLGTV